MLALMTCVAVGFRTMEVTARLKVQKPDGTLVDLVANDTGELIAADEELRAQVVALASAVLAPNHYLHFQATPEVVWTITHNLGFNPGVTVVDSTGRQVEGDVVHLSANTVEISFTAAFAGSAFLS